jgi:hypothetical protein
LASARAFSTPPDHRKESAMSSVVPFRPVAKGYRLTADEIAKAVAWSNARGPQWVAVMLEMEDGGLTLGLVTPSSVEPGDDPGSLAWYVERTSEGLILLNAWSSEPVGRFSSIDATLEAVKAIEAKLAGQAT